MLLKRNILQYLTLFMLVFYPLKSKFRHILIYIFKNIIKLCYCVPLNCIQTFSLENLQQVCLQCQHNNCTLVAFLPQRVSVLLVSKYKVLIKAVFLHPTETFPIREYLLAYWRR